MTRIENNEINRLKEMELYRKDYIGNVSHELKTPIFIAQSYIETLLDGSLYDNEVNKKHLKKSLKSILRLSSIVKDLELISDLEKEKLVLEKEVFDIAELIRDTVDSLEINANNEKIDINFEIPEGERFFVFADEDKIEQVLTNLLMNAIKYNLENGYIRISIKELKEKYQIKIKDNGLGIKEENISRIFERFYRVNKDRSRKKGGTGLGLAIVKHILEAHDEQINVKSKLNEGSEFYFNLEKVKR